MRKSMQIAIAAIFAALAFVARAYIPAIPIVPPIVFDFRGFFVFSGAALVSLPFAVIIGVVSGLPASMPYVDIPSYALAAGVVSILSLKLKWWAIPFGPVVGVISASSILAYTGTLPFNVAVTTLMPRVIINTTLSLLFVWYLSSNRQLAGMLGIRVPDRAQGFRARLAMSILGTKH